MQAYLLGRRKAELGINVTFTSNFGFNRGILPGIYVCLGIANQRLRQIFKSIKKSA